MTHDGSSFFKDGARPAAAGVSRQVLQEGLARLVEMGHRLGEAQGLVAQISDALAAGDDTQAEAKVRQAADLPYDEGEGHWTGTQAAHQHLWDTVTDFLESWPSDDPSAWVDTVVQHAQAATDHAERELRTVMGGIANDYALPLAQRKRLEELGTGSERGYSPPVLPELADRAEHIRQVAALTADLATALEQQAAAATSGT